MQPDAALREYYARRAAEYERIYDKPERQADLSRLRRELPPRFRDAALLEIACGTGYWTALLAAEAASVLATDAAEETLAIARAKPYPRGNVRFALADAYDLPAWPGRFDACFAGFWWSHVPRSRLERFLAGLHARLAQGARVAFLDNRYVEGSSTPLSRSDAEGNTYQMRRMADGSRHEVLKNFPGPGELEARLARHGADVEVREYQYYWLATYRIMAARP
jgi:demethylmenaquinone methyltransferase/2-methoxy-6-polyprenyl-1,4-benzoquinol methylase